MAVVCVTFTYSHPLVASHPGTSCGQVFLFFWSCSRSCCPSVTALALCRGRAHVGCVEGAACRQDLSRRTRSPTGTVKQHP